MDDRHGGPAAQGPDRLSALPRRDAALKAAAGRAVLSNRAIAGVAATFLLMGLVVSTYGPLLELLTRRFGVSLPAAGSIISVHFAGGLAGVVTAMWTLAHRPARDTFVGGVVVGGVGCAVVALAPVWPVFLAGIVVVGFGFGSLVIGLNQLIAYSTSARPASLLNGLNAAYSGGAVIGPLIVALFASRHFSAVFLAAAAAAIIVAASASGVSGRLPVTAGAPARPGFIVGIFVCAFVFYVGIETGAGGWMASHLQSTGLSAGAAAAVTSAFFLALVSGRLLSALIPARVPEHVVVLAGSAAATLALAASTVPQLAPGAYVVTGLALAPIFPTGIAWLSRLLPDDSRATAWLFPAASIGGVTGPGLIGIVVGAVGVRWAPGVLAGVAVMMTATFAFARRSTA